MQLAVNQEPYQLNLGGTITVQQAALTTDKSAATVDLLAAANRIIITPSNGSVELDLRFRGVMTNADSNTVVMYAMRGDSDHYKPIATLTLTTGTQIFSSGNLFVDTIGVANRAWPDAIVPEGGGLNGIASLWLNTHGYKKFLFLCTSKAVGTTSIMIDVARG